VKNIGNSFIGILTILGVCFVVFIIYVSLLGENNKIDTVVDNFFASIKEQGYFSFEDNKNIVANFDVFDIDGEYSENCFSLELALLSKYNISDASDYKIKIKKSHFGIPFTKNSNIHIDVLLKDSEDPNNFSIFQKSEQNDFVKNIFTVERKGGRWLITAINIQNSTLFESINHLRESLNIDSYVSISGTKVDVKPIEIDTKNITNIERRKLNYIFQKVYQLTETSADSNRGP
jgi:hypothetical protein